MRTFADWHEPPPGSMEMDLVAHCGAVNVNAEVILTRLAAGSPK